MRFLWISSLSTQPLPLGSPLNGVTVTITIPADRGDIFSIGHIGLWCVRFTQDFGHVDIPSAALRGRIPRYVEVLPIPPVAPTEPPVRYLQC